MLRVVCFTRSDSSEYIRSICLVWKQTVTKKNKSVFLVLNGRGVRTPKERFWNQRRGEGGSVGGQKTFVRAGLPCKKNRVLLQGRESSREGGRIEVGGGYNKNGRYRSCSPGPHDSTVGSKLFVSRLERRS